MSLASRLRYGAFAMVLVLWLPMLAPRVVLAQSGPPATPPQPAEARAVTVVRQNFEAGNFREALTEARSALAAKNFTDEERLALHKLAGLAAFNLGDKTAAGEHLYQVLQLDPDHVLDRFAVAPAAIDFFQGLKKKNADALSLIRQQLALREEQRKQEQAELERKRAEAEAERRRIEALSRRVTVRTVERQSFAVNFVPFGAGQFQQGKTGWGVFFAATEGVLAAASIGAYLALDAMVIESNRTLDNQLGAEATNGKQTLTVRGIPASRRGEADAWRTIKYATGIGFYGVYALGVAHAIVGHQDEVVRTTVVDTQSDAPERADLSPSQRTPDVRGAPPASPPPRPSARPLLFPLAGGLGAGLSVRF